MLDVGLVKISCGLLPTRFSSVLLCDTITVKKTRSSSLVVEITYTILAKIMWTTREVEIQQGFSAFSNNIGWGSGVRRPELGRHPGNCIVLNYERALSTMIFARIVASESLKN